MSEWKINNNEKTMKQLLKNLMNNNNNLVAFALRYVKVSQNVINEKCIVRNCNMGSLHGQCSGAQSIFNLLVR